MGCLGVMLLHFLDVQFWGGQRLLYTGTSIAREKLSTLVFVELVIVHPTTQKTLSLRQQSFRFVNVDFSARFSGSLVAPSMHPIIGEIWRCKMQSCGDMRLELMHTSMLSVSSATCRDAHLMETVHTARLSSS